MRTFVLVSVVVAVCFAGGARSSPRSLGELWVDHDTGNIKLSVTCVGGIGSTQPPSDVGNGLHFPKTGPNLLFHGSLLLTNAEDYVVDRFFGQGAQPGHDSDFVTIDSLERGSAHGYQEYGCLMDDANHPNAKGLQVDQYTIATADSGYEDFVIFFCEISNPTYDTVSDLYFGTWLDLDIANAALNTAGTDTVRRCTYMHSSSTEYPTAGVKLLAPPGWANLCCVFHPLYVYPDSEVSERTKYRLMSGDIRVFESDTANDWSVANSWGPFSLLPGASQRVDFAVVGGLNVADFLDNCDSAQSFHTHLVNLMEETPQPPQRVLGVFPNPFSSCAYISLTPGQADRLAVRVYDAAGNLVRTLWDGSGACPSLAWNGCDNFGRLVHNGIYFIESADDRSTHTQKVVLSRRQ